MTAIYADNFARSCSDPFREIDGLDATMQATVAESNDTKGHLCNCVGPFPSNYFVCFEHLQLDSG